MHKVHNNAVPESIREIFSVNSNQRYLANRMQTTFLKRVIYLIIVTALHQYGRLVAQYSKTKSLA